MHIVEQLLYYSERDTELLQSIASRGDDPNMSRDVDFCLMAKDQMKANTVCSFINDNRYGLARVEGDGDSFRIVTVANIPLHPHIVHSMSANMVSLAHVFSVDYVGWGCCVQNA